MSENQHRVDPSPTACFNACMARMSNIGLNNVFMVNTAAICKQIVFGSREMAHI